MRLQLNAVALLAAMTLSCVAHSAGAQSSASSLARLDTRAGIYQDTDRTTIVTNNVAARSTPTDHIGVDARYLVDVITSASVDVVTAATTAFQDTRHELEGGASYRDDSRRLTASYIYSTENDWRSHTGSVGAQHDFLDHNLTVKIGASLVANEVGRQSDPRFQERLTVAGASAGVAMVLSPADLLDLGYSISYLDGYQESPYRFVYFGGAVRSPLPPSQPEEVPERRVRHSLTVRWNRHLFRDTALRSHVRGYRDDWGITSLTAGTEYVVGFGPIETGAFVRGYTQQHADFYRPQYAERKRYMTADRELATFVDAFVGLRAGWRRERVSVFESVHAEAKLTGFAFQFIDFPRLRERSGLIAELAAGVAF